MLSNQDELKDFRPWPQWLLAGKGGEIFRTPGALAWFLRKHRKRLVESGVLILRSGPGGHYLSARFEQTALEIMREESASRFEELA